MVFVKHILLLYIFLAVSPSRDFGYEVLGILHCIDIQFHMYSHGPGLNLAQGSLNPFIFFVGGMWANTDLGLLSRIFNSSNLVFIERPDFWLKDLCQVSKVAAIC